MVETRHDDGSRRRWRLFYDSSEGQTNTFEVNAADVGEITAQPPQFAELLAHCAANGEVTFTPTPAALEVQCRTDGGRDDDDVVSELSIQAADFEQYVLPDGARGDSRDAIAFQARQPKALVKWCDAADVLAVNFYFGRLPKPVCLMAHAPAGANLRIVASTHVPPREGDAAGRAGAGAGRRAPPPRRAPTRGWRRRACTASGSIRRTSRRRSPDMCGRVCKKESKPERSLAPESSRHPRKPSGRDRETSPPAARRAPHGLQFKGRLLPFSVRRTSRGTQPRLPRRPETHRDTMGAGSSVDMATAGLDLPDGGPPPPGADAEFDALVDAEMRKRSSGAEPGIAPPPPRGADPAFDAMVEAEMVRQRGFAESYAARNRDLFDRDRAVDDARIRAAVERASDRRAYDAPSEPPPQQQERKPFAPLGAPPEPFKPTGDPRRDAKLAYAAALREQMAAPKSSLRRSWGYDALPDDDALRSPPREKAPRGTTFRAPGPLGGAHALRPEQEPRRSPTRPRSRRRSGSRARTTPGTWSSRCASARRATGPRGPRPRRRRRGARPSAASPGAARRRRRRPSRRR